MHLLLILLACGDKSEDTGTGGVSPSDTSDTNDTSAGGDDTAASACAVVTPGTDWAWSGECPQMRTPCDILVADCVMSIDYAADGGMTMDMPYGGVIAGDTVTFNDDNGVTGCVGTVIDPDTIEGSCASGCTFALRR